MTRLQFGAGCPSSGDARRRQRPDRLHQRRLENRFFKITLDGNGEITSLYDKRVGREVMDQSSYCKGNALLTFEDKPMTYDAWDIDIFYQDKMTPVQALDSIEVIEQGPLRATVEIKRSFGAGSRITQRISLYRDLPRIDFATDADWQERQTLLKAAFPVAVHSPRATYDIQFGNVERPTHWNTSWDWARFEVCGHKWADISEGDYGVSLLSDSKYGWDIKGNVMRLTLLKGAISPDPDADRGRHQFSYALYPHAGDWRAAETVRRAYEFNVPVLSTPAREEKAPGDGERPAAVLLPRLGGRAEPHHRDCQEGRGRRRAYRAPVRSLRPARPGRVDLRTPHAVGGGSQPDGAGDGRNQGQRRCRQRPGGRLLLHALRDQDTQGADVESTTWFTHACVSVMRYSTVMTKIRGWLTSLTLALSIYHLQRHNCVCHLSGRDTDAY